MPHDDADGTADTLAAEGASAPVQPVAHVLSPALPRVEKECYEVGDEVARGGLGRIMRAIDKRLDRPVAIKELLRDEPDHAARFAREALLTARLQHPAIVPVYEAGLWPDGSPFYAMKLVSGKSLEAAVRERDTLSERLGLLPHVIHVVEALAYAHEKKIIHRDLKPANVLVGAFGETVVIDWGLAKDLASDVPEPKIHGSSGGSGGGQQTEAGSVMGTPAYMPPEQAMGQRVDPRADVYALGALLYHVIAGGPPYSGTSSQEILTAVVHESPLPLEEKEPEAPRELAAIVRKAMARDPDERYATAAELAEDLSRFQRGLLVRAHQYSTATLVARWARRNRAPLAVAAAMLGVLLAVIAVDVRRIVSERDIARAERAEAQRLRVQADQRGDELALRESEELLGRDPHQALTWLMKLTPESGAYGAARILAADALARGLPARVIGDLQAGALAASPDGKLLAAARADDVILVDVATLDRMTLRGRGGEERALAFSPGGGKLAFAAAGGGLRLWDRQVRASTELAADSEVTALTWDGDQRVVAVDRAGNLRVWDVGHGAPRSVEAHTGPVLALDAQKGRAITGGSDGVARLWDLETLKPLATMPHGAAVGLLRFGPAGEVVTLAADQRARTWDAAGAFASVLGDVDAEPTALAVAADGLVAAGDGHGDLFLWRAGKPERRLSGHTDEVRALAFAAGGLVSAGRDGTIRVHDVASGRGRALLGHEGGVLALAMVGDRLASAARDHTVRLWDLARGQPRVAGGAGAVRALAASTDGRLLATGGEAGQVTLWDAGKLAPRPLAPAPAPVRALAFAPDGASFVAGTADGGVLLYATGGNVPQPLARLDGDVAAVAFDLRSRVVAAAGPGGLRVVDLESGKERVHDIAPAAGLAFSPGGTLLASAGAALQLWEVDRGRARLLEGGRGPYTSVACSQQLVAAGGTEGATVWRVASGAVTPMPAPGGPYLTLAFTPDGKTLVGRGERGLRVWDVGSGASLALDGLGGAPLAMALSPDGQSAAAAAGDGSVRLWDLGSRRGRPLTGHAGAATGVVWLAGAAVATAGVDGTVRVWPDDLPHEPTALRAALGAAMK